MGKIQTITTKVCPTSLNHNISIIMRFHYTTPIILKPGVRELFPPLFDSVCRMFSQKILKSVNVKVFFGTFTNIEWLH